MSYAMHESGRAMDPLRIVQHRGYEIRVLAWLTLGKNMYQAIFDVLDANGAIVKNTPQGAVSGAFRSIEFAQEAAIAAASQWIDASNSAQARKH